MKKIAPITVMLILLLHSSLFSQTDTLRICSYNLLKFSENSGASRLKYMRHIMNEIDPDVLVVQEMMTPGGVKVVLDSVFNYLQPDKFSSGPFVDGPDTDNAIFYRTGKLTLDTNRQLATDLRDISEYTLKSGDVTFRVYSLHLKASSGSSNESRRLAEVAVLRSHLNNLNPTSSFLVAGDYNIYSASEPAFSKLTGSETDNDGRAFDPLGQSGNWHNNPNYSAIHTQSVRTEQFGGGSTGGLDDRFDMILVSESMLSQNTDPKAISMYILPETYTAFGNDGNHFNQSIVTGNNSAVDFSTADALHEMSDHLPLYADFVVRSNSIVSAIDEAGGLPENYVLQQNYPNPFNPTTTISYRIAHPAEVALLVYDTAGRLLATIVDELQQPGEHNVSFSARDFASGIYIYRLQVDGRFEVAKKMTVLK